MIRPTAMGAFTKSRILRQAGLGRSLVLRFGSAESVEDKLCETPALLCQTDEFDGVLLMAKNSRDPRFEAILDKFKELYTSSDETYTTRCLVSRDSREIHQPSLPTVTPTRADRLRVGSGGSRLPAHAPPDCPRIFPRRSFPILPNLSPAGKDSARNRPKTGPSR